MDRYAFLIAGSNCCGKTTLVKRVLDRLAADGFDDRHIFNARADSGSFYKGKTLDQEQKLLEAWESKAGVVIFEGTRINTLWKLEYEGMRRYPNYFSKMRIANVKRFTMDLEYQVAAEIEAYLEARIREVLT